MKTTKNFVGLTSWNVAANENMLKIGSLSLVFDINASVGYKKSGEHIYELEDMTIDK